MTELKSHDNNIAKFEFDVKYDDFAEKRTIRPVTPYPGSPLYYDAINSGLLDKDNPAEDFYENKHTVQCMTRILRLVCTNKASILCINFV